VVVVQGSRPAVAVPTPSTGIARTQLVLVVNLKIVHRLLRLHIVDIYDTITIAHRYIESQGIEPVALRVGCGRDRDEGLTNRAGLDQLMQVAAARPCRGRTPPQRLERSLQGSRALYGNATRLQPALTGRISAGEEAGVEPMGRLVKGDQDHFLDPSCPSFPDGLDRYLRG
jgi:hypothetical protein